MNKTQKGFALIESLLIILILIIIGFGGYYVWHTQKDNNKVTDDTLKAGNSQTAAPVNSDSKSASQKYLTIKEWGVRVPYSSSDTFEYTNDTSTPNLVEVRSDKLAASYGCTEIGAGLISRSLPTDQAQSAADGTTVAEYASQNPGTFYKVGNYYYAWAHDQAACSNSVTPDAQNQASTEFEGFVKNIQDIPQ